MSGSAQQELNEDQDGGKPVFEKAFTADQLDHFSSSIEGKSGRGVLRQVGNKSSRINKVAAKIVNPQVQALNATHDR